MPNSDFDFLAKSHKTLETMEEQHEKPLQALLLADSFTSTFRPISLEKPKVLFPLGNAPMLAYSLEFLASNDVKQVFIFCINHADQIKEYVESSGNYIQYKCKIIFFVSNIY